MIARVMIMTSVVLGPFYKKYENNKHDVQST